VPTADLVLEACSVTRWFGEQSALDRVDLGVSRGSVHGLLGANGAGKTTLLAAVLGLVPVADLVVHVTLLGVKAQVSTATEIAAGWSRSRGQRGDGGNQGRCICAARAATRRSSRFRTSGPVSLPRST
jgi:energy-coupling factor transporter ATP-binding protein EcfA2